MPHLAIQAASSQRASSTDRMSIMPAQFVQAVVIGLARQVVEGVTEEVHIAPLEDRFGQDLADRHAKAGVIVGDDELDAVEAPPTQAEEEVLPG
jgi:hypothetical protein